MSTVDRDAESNPPDPRMPDTGADVVSLRPRTARDPVEPQPPLREVIGVVLRDERHAQRRTLADVATGAYVSLPYLSEVERGRKEPSSDVLASICAALEIPLADVLERSADRLRARAQRHGGIQLLAA